MSQNHLWLRNKLYFVVRDPVQSWRCNWIADTKIYECIAFLTRTLFFAIYNSKEQNITQQFFRQLMGACLSSQSKRQQNSTLPVSKQSRQLRTEIAKQLNEPSIAEPSPHLPSQSKIPAADAKSAKSLKNFMVSADRGAVEDLREGTSKKERKLQNSLHKIPQGKENNISQKELAKQEAEKQSASQSQSNENSNSSEDTLENEESADVQTETPENRIKVYNANEVGYGLNDSDNKLIASTMSAAVPVRLGEVKLANSSSYVGEWMQGKREGQGVVRWQDGSMYSGQWHNNCSHGKGKLTYANGGVYEGDFVCNRAEGKGVFTYPDGSRYQGEWKNNQREGNGILSWKDGQKYDGNWVNNKKQGHGHLSFRDGSYYKGEFNSNQIHGHGFYSWYNSREYEGQWEHNQMSGFGVLKWANGERYEGRFLNSKYQGQGTLTLPDGSCSTGHWQKGRKHGLFQQKDCAGKIQIVEWHLGKRLKQPQEKKKGVRQLNTQSSQTRTF